MRRFFSAAALLGGASLVSVAQGATVDFETLPGGTPAEGVVVSDQWASEGVTLTSNAGMTLVLVETGGDTVAAFGGPPDQSGIDAVADPAHNGSFFVSDIPLGFAAGVVRLEFALPQQSVSAEILDIDGSESWQARIRDSTGDILDTITRSAGDPGTGDGVATLFAFTRDQPDIAVLEFDHIGPPIEGGGWGLDNLEFTPLAVSGPVIPLPAAAWSALGLLSGLGALRVLRGRLL
jgi:hypothetical protein